MRDTLTMGVPTVEGREPLSGCFGGIKEGTERVLSGDRDARRIREQEGVKTSQVLWGQHVK